MWKMLMKGITKVISVLFFKRHRYSLLSVPEPVGEKKQNKKTEVFFLQYGAANGNTQHSQTTCSID